ncbi:MAG: PAS domain S-box protein, partial [Mycobacterium sp.]|nr:PAS domain S-box protein [Mycobacterium sp.]
MSWFGLNRNRGGSPHRGADVSDESQLLELAHQSDLEPWALLQAVRDPAGRVMDFVYRDINPLAARQHQSNRADLIGRSLTETLPAVTSSGLLEMYAHCVETGDPLVLDGFRYYGKTLPDATPDPATPAERRYDVRGTRVDHDYLSLTWHDVTDRVETLEALRVTVDANLDPQVLMHPVRSSGGEVIDFTYREANLAACRYTGLRHEELIGRSMLATSPGIRESGLLERYAHCVHTGEPVALADFPYLDGIRGDVRRYDIRATRTAAGGLSLTWRDVTDHAAQQEAAERAHQLLRTATDAMLDPQAVVEVIRDPAGDVVDLVYRDVNRAFCEYVGMTREAQVGRSLLETFPGVDGAGLMARYAHCALTGEPVVLNNFPYFNELQGETRNYDIRGNRVRPDLLVLTFRDTTERFAAVRELAAAEERYRLLALNSSDAITHVRDGVVVWVSPAIAGVLGAGPEHWVGTRLRDVVPTEDLPAFEQRWAILDAGGTVLQRIRVVSVDGVTHWVHLHATPFYHADGRRDGTTATLRLIDEDVAAERELAEALRREAAANALYRRSMESAAVGMCLASPQGPLIEVNQAMCEFFGYDAPTLLSKTWIELTAPEYRDADLANVADMVAGRVESYEMDKQFIHADGHRIWGHLAVGCLRGSDGSVAMSIGQIIDITDQVAARQAVERYRKLMETSNVGMCLTTAEGLFTDVNEAMCELFGLDRATMLRKTWQDLTPEPYLQADLRNVEEMLAGRRETYRVAKEFLHADGHQFWGDLSASCIRMPNGAVEYFVAQITDITDRMLAQQRLQADLDTAVSYVRSLLPDDLSGPVQASSRYLPTRELGGDSFGYSWIDDDHLSVYLLDVSGHGVE